MLRWLLRGWIPLGLGVGLLVVIGLAIAQQTINRHTEIFAFVNGIILGESGSGRFLGPMPATETVAAGATITANACGAVKAVTAAGAVATSTTDTFTAPAPSNAGCLMGVCNVGATNTITLKRSARFLTAGGVDLALAANTCVMVGSEGAAWRQLAAILTAT